MKPASSSVQPIPKWWQLPFAMALAKHRLLPIRCNLCGVNWLDAYKNKSQHSHNNEHWFNQLVFLCDDCHQAIAWQQSQFELEIITNNEVKLITGIASSYYQFPYQQIIRDFKNTHQLDKLPLLVHAIRQLDKPPNCHSHNSVIVPVPTTIKRLTARGFDPVTILVQYLSYHWHIPVFTGVIREERQKQQGLSREQRLINSQNAFTFIDVPTVQNVILFDDVATTGATLQSLASSLLSGAGQYSSSQPYKITARALAHG